MKIKVIKGDITTIEADAIVNAANSSLLGGGGVDGAIHRKGGERILAECIEIRNRQGGCKTGEAVITTGGNLPAKHVIHTVGPIWQGGKKGESDLLKACYINSLRLAKEHTIKSIAFPNISTGIYGYPKELAVNIAVATIEDFSKTDESNGFTEVIFVCYDDENYRLYLDKLKDSMEY
jgi:O-acetyl-ADP-ribose deacetylase